MAKTTTAIVLAAGAGRRMGGALAKQFLPLGGVPLVVHSLSTFQNSAAINEIILVVAKNSEEMVRREILERHGISKCSCLVAGGEQRQDSVANALAILAQDVELLIIHDGVRPFVSGKMIANCLEAALEYGASTVGVPLKDTIKKVTTAGFVAETPSRTDFWLAQTPQAFRREVISAAYEWANQNRFYATDDAALVERIGMPVKMVTGAYSNIKLTTAEDISFARALGGERTMALVGFGYDSHRLVEGRVLLIGGIEIPFAKGLLGHSDADVLLHAIIDAIIGAMGSGDIGGFFPDNDIRYQNADSTLFFGEVIKLAQERGLLVGNIDASVILEAPRLAPFVGAMRAKIANIAGVSPERVNIKAKTNEKMGFVGAGEGVAAFAIVTLKEGCADGDSHRGNRGYCF